MKFLFTFYCLILFSLEGMLNKYSYFNVKDQEGIKRIPLVQDEWDKNVGEFQNVLYAPGNASDSLIKSLKTTREELKDLSYKLTPCIDLSTDADFLCGSNIRIDEFEVGCTFFYLVQQLLISCVGPTLAERVKCFVGEEQTWDDNKDGQSIEVFKQDSEFSYRIKRLVAGIVKNATNEWEIVKKILSEEGSEITTKDNEENGVQIKIVNGIHTMYKDLCGSDKKPMTMTFANTLLNLCCLASDSKPNLFGSKIMALIRKINENKRIKAFKLRINFYKFDFTKFVKAGAGIDIDEGTYYPMLVPEGYKVVYPAISFIYYLQHGIWKLPIGRILSGNMSIEDYEISGNLKLLGPSQQLVNVLPIGEVGASTVFTEISDETGENKVTYKSLEPNARLCNNISFDTLGAILLWPNGSSYGTSTHLGGAMYSGHDEDTFKNKFELSPVGFPSLKGGRTRKQGQVETSDIISILFGDTAGYSGDKSTLPDPLNKVAINYTDYTIYSLSLKEIKGDVLNEPLTGGNDDATEGIETRSTVLVPGCPSQDIPKDIEIADYWTLHL